MKSIGYYLMPEADYCGEYDRKEVHYLVKKESVTDGGLLIFYRRITMKNDEYF